MRPTKLVRELAGAIADEERRSAIDAAKKKAVAQHADYDTFKKMVSVAHLKPLHAPRSQSNNKSLTPAWQLDPGSFGIQQPQLTAATPCESGTAATSTHTNPNNNMLCAQPAAHGPAAALPRTSQEFAREWRRHCPTADARYSFLQHCGAERLAAVFRVEIDGQMLSQVLQALHHGFAAACRNHHHHGDGQAAAPSCQPEQQQAHQQPEQQQQEEGGDVDDAAAASAALSREAADVVRLLHSLTGSGRFSMSVRLLDAAGKEAAAALCSALRQQCPQDHSGVAVLAQLQEAADRLSVLQDAVVGAELG